MDAQQKGERVLWDVQVSQANILIYCKVFNYKKAATHSFATFANSLKLYFETSKLC